MTCICSSSQLLQTLFIFILQSRRCVCFHLVAMFSDFSCQPWSVVITPAITLSQKVNISSFLPSYTFDRSIFWALAANWARTRDGPQNLETKKTLIFSLAHLARILHWIIWEVMANSWPNLFSPDPLPPKKILNIFGKFIKVTRGSTFRTVSKMLHPLTHERSLVKKVISNV